MSVSGPSGSPSVGALATRASKRQPNTAIMTHLESIQGFRLFHFVRFGVLPSRPVETGGRSLKTGTFAKLEKVLQP
jgi:hypothetical protein